MQITNGIGEEMRITVGFEEGEKRNRNETKKRGVDSEFDGKGG